MRKLFCVCSERPLAASFSLECPEAVINVSNGTVMDTIVLAVQLHCAPLHSCLLRSDVM